MTLSQKSGVTIIPLLARIVLGLAFITMGMAKLKHVSEYTPAQAQKLAALGVMLEAGPAPVEAAPSKDESSDDQASAVLRSPAFELASLTPGQDGGEQDTGDAAAGDDTQSGQTIDVPNALEPAEVYHGSAKWHIALIMDAHNMPEPVLMTQVATWTEFVGGILILLGFLSRVWGLGLAIVMGMAFYTTSMSGYFAGFPNGIFRIAAQEPGTYMIVFTQLGLFVLALGVLLTGPGPISIDRLIMPRKSSGDEYDEDDEPSVQI